MTQENIVEVHHLSKSFNGKKAVDDISLTIKKGEIFGFLGPNGSGKTTTIRMLCGLMAPDSGRGYCLGQDITLGTRKMKQYVGYVPQSFSLYQDLTVRENLNFVASVYEVSDPVIRVNSILERLKLLPYESILAGRLSGGWKQRLSLAVALVHQPQLLLLDEPTAGVDPKARREFWDDIVAFTQQGMTVLVSTHYMDEAVRCHRLAYMMTGRLMVQGTISNILQQVGLYACVVQGDGLSTLAERLRSDAKLEQVSLWGNELRVCALDMAYLQSLFTHYSQFQWQITDANVEEIFVHLVMERGAGS